MVCCVERMEVLVGNVQTAIFVQGKKLHFTLKRVLKFEANFHTWEKGYLAIFFVLIWSVALVILHRDAKKAMLINL